jgi:hypothetical protein
VSSGGVTATSSVRNVAASPLNPKTYQTEEGRAVEALPSSTTTTTAAGATRSPAPTASPSAATLLAKPMRHTTTPRVLPRRQASRDGALSSRHITVGATLVTRPSAASINVASNTACSPRGAAGVGVGVGDGWTPRRNSTSAAAQQREVRRSPAPGPCTPSPSSSAVAAVATSSRRNSARRRDSGPNNSGSSAYSQATQASLWQDVPRVVKAAPWPRRGSGSLPAQQLLEEGYYLVSDGSANSSFSDTPRSARPASLASTSSRRASMLVLDLNAGSRTMAAAAASMPPSRGVVTPLRMARHDGWNRVGGAARRGSSSSSSSSCESSSDDNSSDNDFVEEDDGYVHYDEEDEEQAVLTYMDSRVEGNCNRGRSGSGHLASPPPPRDSNVGVPAVDGDALDLSVDFGTGNGDGEGMDGPPSRLSVSTPPLLYRRGTSSVRNSSIAREPRPTTPTRTKSGGTGVNTPPHTSASLSTKPGPTPSPQPSGVPTVLSRQHSTAAAQSSSRRSPHLRPVNQSPLQPSPLNSFSVSPYNIPASAEEDARERQCKHLSLHEAFFFNQSRSFWLVDDQVLAKVLEYVRLMGYEHPALKRDRSKGQASLWSSSSAVSSPIAPGKPKKKPTTAPSAVPATAAATALRELSGKVISNPQTSPSAMAAAVADAVSQTNPAATPSASPVTGVAADGEAKEASNPYAFLGKQYHLKSGKPKCAGQYANTTSNSATHLFLTFSEALRWIVEQEYVIGTVLMCCARFVGDAEADGASFIGDGTADGAAWHPRRAMLQRGKPCIPVRLHPIHFVASLVMTHYPQWGGMTVFMRTWETQIRLVLGSAAPSHQRLFKCPDDELILSSDLDAGNLYRVERAPEPYFFLIWLEPDNGSDKRIWFRFSVTGAKEGRTLRFRLMNAAPHAKLYRQNGMMPVWRDGLSQVNWGPVDSCSFRTTNRELDGEVCFSIQARNSTETIQIAFCAPYSYADLLCHVCHWHALVKNSGCDMRFEERVLCRSPEGRKLHLLIVTSRTGGPPKLSRDDAKKGETSDSNNNNSNVGGGGGARSSTGGNANTHGGSNVVNGGAAASGNYVNGGGTAPGLMSPTSAGAASINKARSGAVEVVRGPYSNFSSGKKVILVSGRVHPGEVTASHGVHGLISFLLSSDPRAIQLREHFIFFIVPMLNPDGVSRGHSRLDQYGNNLNRCYNDPDPESQPTVLALRRVFEHLQRTYRDRFIMYLDFHSHASQSSGFMFGNNLPVRVQHWNVFFPRLVELHARHVFSFGLCRFGRVHMTSKDGASRVLFGSSLIHSYTVELTHFTDRRLYADDLAAMNNGSEVLFEVTWPPLHPPPGQAAGNNGDEEGEISKGGGGALRGFNAASPTPRGSPAFFGGRGGSGKPTNSSAAGQRKSQTFPSARGARPRAASASAGSKHTVTVGAGAAVVGGKSDAAGSRKRGTSAGVGDRKGRGASRDSVSTSASPLRLARGGPSLHPIAYPSVLCQSAEVGKACLLALLDYCSIGRPSDELNVFGGMSRVLRDVKRQMKSTSPISSKKAKRSQASATYAGIQPIYKQY